MRLLVHQARSGTLWREDNVFLSVYLHGFASPLLARSIGVKRLTLPAKSMVYITVGRYIYSLSFLRPVPLRPALSPQSHAKALNHISRFFNYDRDLHSLFG